MRITESSVLDLINWKTGWTNRVNYEQTTILRNWLTHNLLPKLLNKNSPLNFICILRRHRLWELIIECENYEKKSWLQSDFKLSFEEVQTVLRITPKQFVLLYLWFHAIYTESLLLVYY